MGKNYADLASQAEDIVLFEKLGSHKMKKGNLKTFPFLDIKNFLLEYTHLNVSIDILF